MSTSKLILEETGTDIQNFKSFITKLINDQINDYKVQFLANWERNHKLSSENKDCKIEKLETTKKEIIDFLEKFSSETRTSKVNFKLNLELVANDKSLVQHSDREMVSS